MKAGLFLALHFSPGSRDMAPTRFNRAAEWLPKRLKLKAPGFYLVNFYTMIKIKKSRRTGEFYFTIYARNGKKLAHSEGYHNRKDCRNAITIAAGAFGTVLDTTIPKSKKQ